MLAASLSARLPSAATPALRAAGWSATGREGTAAPAGMPLSLHEGQQVFAEGDKAERCYEVKQGMVRTQRLLPDGRRQVIDFFCPGEIFALASGSLYSCDAEAVTASTVVAHSLVQIGARLDRDPQLVSQVMRTLTRELASAQEQLLLLGRKTARERLACFLLGLARKSGRSDGTLLSMKRGDIADHLGLTVETVSRLFAGFKRDRLIALDEITEVTFLDRRRLASIAAGEDQRAAA